ncbi:MAG: hypothetical protein KYX69_02760 [Sphingomonas sp.]|uniref:hypothetical protein n=1 Tax=Sphingomonas sp. TaxID=28214 RepID=UPI00260B3BC3|nr:hypothetical protein [Sphingomonas sp.]MDK2766620.1 hypothetical protein [Sphingomonas sp.]
MSGGNGTGRRKTADELLRQLLTEPEHMAVLEYSRDQGLERDSAVFFLVAMLKTFAFVFDRTLVAIETAEAGTDALLAATRQAETRLDTLLTQKHALFAEMMEQNLERMAFYTGEMRSAIGEVRITKDELAKTNKEAVGTYRAYKRLADDGSGTALSQLFQKHALEALDRRVPFYDDTIRLLILTTIARSARKAMTMMGAGFLLVLLVVMLRH